MCVKMATNHVGRILIMMSSILVSKVSAFEKDEIKSTPSNLAMWLLIGCSLVTCPLLGSLCVTCCRRSIAQRKIRKFQQNPGNENGGKLCGKVSLDPTLDASNPIAECTESVVQSTGDKHPEKHKNNLNVQSPKCNDCVRVLENQTYGDILTSLSGEFKVQRHSGHCPNSSNDYDVSKQNQQDAKYENLSSVTLRQKRISHAYETIECVPTGVKIIDSLEVPEPIQIKRASKSEDVTIFPCQVPQESDNPPGNPPDPKRLQLSATKCTTVPMSSIVTARIDIEPSPYLLRTWSAPSPGRIREKPPSPKFSTDLKRKNKRRFIGVSCLGNPIDEQLNLDGKELSASTKIESTRPVRMRRRTKRRVRKTRRYLDERRRKCIAARGQKSSNDAYGGQNRWPLPRLCFDSSSGSDVFRFKCSTKINEACQESSKREASLLEDIWSHLDEITQKSNKFKESFSSRRASVSLISSSEEAPFPSNSGDIISTDGDVMIASRGSTTDRGYSTYNNRTSGRVFSSCISSLGRYSSINSSRDHSLLGNRTRNSRASVPPKIIVSKHIGSGKRSGNLVKSYLSVLEAYFTKSNPIYEELHHCTSSAPHSRCHNTDSNVTNITNNNGVDSSRHTPSPTPTKHVCAVSSRVDADSKNLNLDDVILNNKFDNSISNVKSEAVVTSYTPSKLAGQTKTLKNYVVVAPSVLLRQDDKHRSLAPSSRDAKEATDDPFSVFMEMNV